MSVSQTDASRDRLASTACRTCHLFSRCSETAILKRGLPQLPKHRNLCPSARRPLIRGHTAPTSMAIRCARRANWHAASRRQQFVPCQVTLHHGCRVRRHRVRITASPHSRRIALHVGLDCGSMSDHSQTRSAPVMQARAGLHAQRLHVCTVYYWPHSHRL